MHAHMQPCFKCSLQCQIIYTQTRLKAANDTFLLILATYPKMRRGRGLKKATNTGDTHAVMNDNKAQRLSSTPIHSSSPKAICNGSVGSNPLPDK